MTLLRPGALALLVPLALLAVGYAVFQRRRPARAVRFTNLELLDTVAPRWSGWRRHVPVVLALVTAAALVVALARPARRVLVPRQRAVVVVAIDTSPSMLADDVPPNRFEAAKAAAASFARRLPAGIHLGLVAFSATATVVVAPTTDHELFTQGLDRLQIREQTAIGEAIFAALDAIALSGVQTVGAERPPAAVVLMSDGEPTAGRPVPSAIEAARAAGVPVSTIAFGTRNGTIVLDGQLIPVPVSGETLRVIAEATGGRSFTAESRGELDAVYRDLGSVLASEPATRDVSGWFVGTALAALVAAVVTGVAWTGRFP